MWVKPNKNQLITIVAIQKKYQTFYFVNFNLASKSALWKDLLKKRANVNFKGQTCINNFYDRNGIFNKSWRVRKDWKAGISGFKMQLLQFWFRIWYASKFGYECFLNETWKTITTLSEDANAKNNRQLQKIIRYIPTYLSRKVYDFWATGRKKLRLA